MTGVISNDPLIVFFGIVSAASGCLPGHLKARYRPVMATCIQYCHAMGYNAFDNESDVLSTKTRYQALGTSCDATLPRCGLKWQRDV